MFRKLIWLIAIINLAASVLALALYPHTIVAVHFDLSGEPNSWGNKWVLLFVSLLVLAMAPMYELYLRRTEGNNIAQKNRNVERKMIFFIELFFVGINWILLAGILTRSIGEKNLPGSTDALAFGIISDHAPLSSRAAAALLMLMGLLFLVLGNFLGKIKQNHSLGIRVPWTLKNETVWKKTHRFSGILWVVCGLCLFMIGFAALFIKIFMAEMFCLLIIVLLPAVSIPVIYAWRVYKKITNNNL